MLLQCGMPIKQALILTCDGEHGFLITLGHESEDIVVVKPGFASGYPGEGPRTFAEALELLRAFAVDVDEVVVPRRMMTRLEVSALTVEDLHFLDRANKVRPMRWFDYVYPWKVRLPNGPQRLIAFSPLMPWAIVDYRIEDLARRFFDNEDDCIGKGFRRLEDRIRTRTQLQEHGVRLMQRAFMQEDRLLTWNVPDKAEQVGRAQLFVGAFMAFRNPRAHREDPSVNVQGLAEFLLLNQLFVLEGQAVKVMPGPI